MSRHIAPSRHSVTLHPGPETVQAIVTAAALIACADGHVATRERRSLLRFLRHHGVLARYGRAASLAAFERAVCDLAAMTPQQAAEVAGDLRAVAGKPAAGLVAQVAAHVALADGVTWPQEIALLEVIRDRVGAPAR